MDSKEIAAAILTDQFLSGLGHQSKETVLDTYFGFLNALQSKKPEMMKGDGHIEV